MSTHNLDARIARAIPKLKDVPSVSALARLRGFPTSKTIRKAIDMNPALKYAMEERGTRYIRGLRNSDILSLVSDSTRIANFPDYALELVHARFRRILLAEIKRFNGFPNAMTLSELDSFPSPKTIRGCIASDTVLQETLRRKQIGYINSLEGKGIIRFMNQTNVQDLPDYAGEAVQQKLDAFILDTIGNLEGVPTPHSVARQMESGTLRIRKRIEANQELQHAMETRGRKYILSLPEQRFLSWISESGRLSRLPEYANRVIHERFDKMILREMKKSPKPPTSKSLSRVKGFPVKETIKKRIHANTVLWMEYHRRLGHTPDQAVELALQRDDDSIAAKEALAIRLRNLHAYREMVGLIRCFGDLLKGKIAALSLYPEPLAKASKEMGAGLDVIHVPLRPFKQGRETIIPKADVAVVQGLHRVRSMRNLFNRLYESIGPGATALFTYSERHATAEGFEEAAYRNGFVQVDSGTVFIRSPSDDTLLTHRVAKHDMERVRRKLSGESKAMLFRTISLREDADIPRLVRIQENGEEKLRSPDAEAIEIPHGIEASLSAKFRADSISYAPGPFIVDVESDSGTAAVIGFDAHPERRHMLETEVLPGAPAEDYRRIARKLARNIKERQKAGVIPGQISKIPLKRFRNQ